MISAPAFPPPDPSDPDEVGWPMCTAAAYWRQGRYEESIAEVDLAANSARELGLDTRASELTSAVVTLRRYLERADADPKSVPVSEEYPSIEVLEAIVAMEELRSNQAHADEPPSAPIASTLPSGIFGNGARPQPKLRRMFPKPNIEAPLRLDFDGSILGPKPTSSTSTDDSPATRRSDRPVKR